MFYTISLCLIQLRVSSRQRIIFALNQIEFIRQFAAILYSLCFRAFVEKVEDRRGNSPFVKISYETFQDCIQQFN